MPVSSPLFLLFKHNYEKEPVGVEELFLDGGRMARVRGAGAARRERNGWPAKERRGDRATPRYAARDGGGGYARHARAGILPYRTQDRARF